MVGYFPDPYPDELLYSLIARWLDHLHALNPNDVEASRPVRVLGTLFGSPNKVAAAVALPTGLERLVKSLPPNYPLNVDALIDRLTLFPVYQPFVCPERAAGAREVMRVWRLGGSPMLYGLLGLTRWRKEATVILRYCPACAREDLQHRGETYWRRLFQVPGIAVCPTHRLPLEPASVRPGFFVPATAKAVRLKGVPLNCDGVHGQVLLAYACFVNDLLTKVRPPMTTTECRERYLAELDAAGYVTNGGFIRLRKLAGALSSAYPDGLPKALSAETKEQCDWRWLGWLRPGVSSAQLMQRHFLLMHFLGKSPAEFLDPGPRARSRGFGLGPWYCVNALCPDAHRRVIRRCITEYVPSQGRLKGTFECPTCKCTYRRCAGTEAVRSPPFRFHKYAFNDGHPPWYWVARRGELWTRELRNLWQDRRLSVSDIAKRLFVARRFVISEARRAGLEFPRPGYKDRPSVQVPTRIRLPEQPPAKRCELRRRLWLSLLPSLAGLNVYQYSPTARNTLLWLRRNDRAWLAEHPPPFPIRKIIVLPVTAIDWPRLDVELAPQVPAAAERIRQAPGRAVRVTITTICRELGRVRYAQRRDRLPLTMGQIEAVAETWQDFAFRRINQAILFYRENRTCPSRNKFIYKAGIHLIVAKYPKVREALEKALSECQQNANGHKPDEVDGFEAGTGAV